ncbi:MAG: hypothetical protein U0271_37045 [Polyangiaceae bacterium]
MNSLRHDEGIYRARGVVGFSSMESLQVFGVRRLGVPAFFALAALAVGCAPTETLAPVGESVTFLGQATPAGMSTTDSDVRVALVIEDRFATLYVCGGPSSFGEHSRWFTAELDRDPVRVGEDVSFDGPIVAIAKDGAVATFDVEDGVVSGQVIEPSGLALSLDATELAPAADVGSRGLDQPGLYSTVDDGCRTGVIVFEEDGELAVQGTWCGAHEAASGNIYAQVTPIMPIFAGPSGIRVRVDSTLAEVAGRELVAMPVSPRDLRTPR